MPFPAFLSEEVNRLVTGTPKTKRRISGSKKKTSANNAGNERKQTRSLDGNQKHETKKQTRSLDGNQKHETKKRTRSLDGNQKHETKKQTRSLDGNQRHETKRDSMPYLQFYQKKLRLPPKGVSIEDIQNYLCGNVENMDIPGDYIRWLFPKRQKDKTSPYGALTEEEINNMNNDNKVKSRILNSYRAMLHFCGIKLANSSTGEVTKGLHWRQKFRKLNISPHIYPMITLMLTFLGLFGYDYMKKPFLNLMAKEIFGTKLLRNCKHAFRANWVVTLKHHADRVEIMQKFPNRR